ncbi:MAG: MopE-related protein, partial [Nanoarchaeota archaeon]
MGLRKFATIAALVSSLYSACSSNSSPNVIDTDIPSPTDYVEIVSDEFNSEIFPDVIDERMPEFPSEIDPETISPDSLEVATDYFESGAETLTDISLELGELFDSGEDVATDLSCSDPKLFYLDNDNDGFGNPEKSITACTPPEGYIDNNMDCDDNNDKSYPGALELCNFVDDNCDKNIDDGFSTLPYYLDADNDGYGISTPIIACKNPDPSRYVTISGDCDDSNSNIHPGILEICNGIDDDCDDITDNGGNALCDNGLYCDGQESCTGDSCKPGVPIDCSANDLTLVDTCNHTPDGNSKTKDYFAGFTSGCDETNDKCTTGTMNLTHTCDVNGCGAECDTTHACTSTECDTLDGCVGKNYYDYADVANICKDDCSCTTNVCKSPIIYQNDPRCTPCQSTDDCNGLNKTYCESDLVKYDAWDCINFECVVTTSILNDCNVLDQNRCEGTQIMHENYTCSNTACTLAETTLVQECNDGLYCNGSESCANAACVSGTNIDCSANNLAPVDTCDYTPDGNSKTLDVFAGFTSTCDEAGKQCTTGTINIISTCDVAACAAQCDAAHTCSDTPCNSLDGCVDKNYYDYIDVTNTCNIDCTCTANACANPTIIYNDARCTQCQTDDNCNTLDRDYCLGDLIKHDEGKCVDFSCVVQTTTTQDCNTLNKNKCVGTQIMHDNYTCSNANCTLAETTLVQECNDGLYCNGDETCANAACVSGTNIDCSANNLAPIDICNYTPDGNSKTLDVFAGFTSTCDEAGKQCTTGTINIISTCDVAACAAQCDTTHACLPTDCDTLDGCVGKNYHNFADKANICNLDCTCTNNACSAPTITYNDVRCTECQMDDNCAPLNKNYCNGSLIKQDLGKCIDFSCVVQTTTTQECNILDTSRCDGTKIMHDNYTCTNAACALAETTFVQECNDGLHCNGNESCTNAACVAGAAVDCSVNNLAPIDTCNYTSDGNSKTKDYFAGFISNCDEANDKCTTGTMNLTHTCDVTGCAAQCDATHTCVSTECDTLDGCVGKNYQDFSNVGNICKDNCTCTTNVCANPVITYNDARCTQCQTDDNCNTLDRDYCLGDLVKHDEGKCVNYSCTKVTTTVSDCNTLDVNKCVGTQIMHDNYTCSNANCNLAETTFVQECNDGLYCNGTESCDDAACVSGITKDCSDNNLPFVDTCNYTPDGNSKTFDKFAGFTSTCDDVNKQCTTGTFTLTHTCDVTGCGAQCDATHTCVSTECDTLD